MRPSDIWLRLLGKASNHESEHARVNCLPQDHTSFHQSGHSIAEQRRLIQKTLMSKLIQQGLGLAVCCCLSRQCLFRAVVDSRITPDLVGTVCLGIVYFSAVEFWTVLLCRVFLIPKNKGIKKSTVGLDQKS